LKSEKPLGKLIDGLDGDRVFCFVLGALQSKLVSASGIANGTDVDAFNTDKVCMEVGAALGKLVNAIDGDTVCLHQDI
jgi:hypothetical protein